MKSTLHEITEQYNYLLDCLYDEDYDEETLMDTLEGLDGELEEKADGYAKVLQILASDTEALKKEEERLAAKRKVLENRSKWLKGKLYDSMKSTGKTKFKTLLFSFAVQKNGGKQPIKIDDPSAAPESYFIPQPPVLDTDAVRKALESGTSLTWAHLEPRGEHLTIW